jgi:hypothetical protein
MESYIIALLEQVHADSFTSGYILIILAGFRVDVDAGQCSELSLHAFPFSDGLLEAQGTSTYSSE